MTQDKLLFRYLDSINWSKKNYLLDPSSEEASRFSKEYVPFVINTFLAGSYDTVLLANHANISPKMSPERQYAFLIGHVRQRRRYIKWPRKGDEELAERLAIYYDVSLRKAREYIPMHTKEQITEIVEATDPVMKKGK